MQIKTHGKNTRTFIGRHSNAQIGAACNANEGEFKDLNIGKFGSHKQDDKGRQLRNVMCSNGLLVANKWCESNSYVMCKIFNAKGSVHQIYHVIVNKKMMQLV